MQRRVCLTRMRAGKPLSTMCDRSQIAKQMCTRTLKTSVTGTSQSNGLNCLNNKITSDELDEVEPSCHD